MSHAPNPLFPYWENEWQPYLGSVVRSLAVVGSLRVSGRPRRCKRNTAYDGDTAKLKVPTVKSHSGTTKNKATSSSLSHVVCKENEAYGGVAAGYKVIREVALYLCRRCLIPPVFVSHPTRHTNCPRQPHVKTPVNKKKLFNALALI